MTGTKERPILFSGPMVRAILDGRKTQTRRPVKHRLPVGPCDVRDIGNVPEIYGAGGVWLPLSCPYGKPGDRLWVREEFHAYHCDKPRAVYRADGEPCRVHKQIETYEVGQWTPSIHMPRWASRITLEVTDVRVERVQDISKADVRAEGVACSDCWTAGTPYTEFPDDEQCGCLNKFANLWDSINADRGFGWDVNPWVWVVEFKRINR